MASADCVLSDWSRFFVETARFLEECERQYGQANMGYTEYTLERLDMCMNTCRSLGEYLSNEVTAHPQLVEYCQSLDELSGCLRTIHSKWLEHESVIESSVASFMNNRGATTSTGVARSDISRCGRPRFEVSRDQVTYLSSLSFKWTEIAAMLGVSRMTLYRCVVNWVMM